MKGIVFVTVTILASQLFGQRIDTVYSKYYGAYRSKKNTMCFYPDSTFEIIDIKKDREIYWYGGECKYYGKWSINGDRMLLVLDKYVCGDVLDTNISWHLTYKFSTEYIELISGRRKNLPRRFNVEQKSLTWFRNRKYLFIRTE